MKLLTSLISAIALLYPIASSGQTRQHDITVQGIQMTPARWVSNVSERLDSVLVYPQDAPSFGDGSGSGIVSVQFQTDDHNRPVALRLARSSRNRVLDRFGMRAIERLGELPTMPGNFKAGQQFRANIIYALSDVDYIRQLKILKREETARRLAEKDRPQSVALVVTLGATTDS